MRNITTIFNKKMKMSDLIDADYNLLLLLTRLNISLGFGEKSIADVCKEHNFDADCFVFLANYQSNKSIINVQEAFEQLPLEPFLFYLKSSHNYFLRNRLPNIRRKLEKVFSEEEKDVKSLVLEFFDNYMREVFEHMQYEDEVVFPYVKVLINESSPIDYSIDIFEDRHNDIEESMHELKRILMKYVAGTKDQRLMTNILLELYISEDELESHTFIEDNLVIPRVKMMEKLKLKKEN